ncbi:uncharacterized protein [Nicotiana tomentosiformis]|uniref:uncharacterized protein n=1 Tax=Nicotiana tomentosiformis TaxID=4098 RepID=UPI00388CD999
MSVTQYEMRFSELARDAIWWVPTERESIRRFIDGITYGLHFIMTREIARGARFDMVVDIFRRLELVRSQDHEERGAKRPRGSGGFSSASSGGQSYHIRVRPYRPTQMASPVHRSASSSHGSYSARPGQSSFSALPAPSLSHAPSVQGSSMPCSSSGYFCSQGPIQSPTPLSDRGCFECEELGNVRRYCPSLLGGRIQQKGQAMISAPVTSPTAQLGRDGTQIARGCPRGEDRSGGSQARCYAFPARARPEHVASDTGLRRIEWRGSLDYVSSRVISYLKVQQMVRKGCLAYLDFVRDVGVDTPTIGSVPVEGMTIAYALSHLKTHEKNYFVHDLELEAIVHALKI